MERGILMNKYQMMFVGAVGLMIGGTLLSVYGIISENAGLFCGIAMAAAGLLLLGVWISKAYTYICTKCYLRIDVGIKEALTALPSGGDCRKIYCPKCRRKMPCKARRISLRAHVY